MPARHQLLGFQRGTTLCATAPGATDTLELTAGSARIEVRDPIFAVAVSTQQVVVWVDRGFVQVRSADGKGQARLAGPGTQVVVPEGEAARRPEASDPGGLDPSGKEALARMESAMPAPDFGFPRPEGSAVLTRIQRQRVLRVGIEQGASPKTLAFVESFFRFVEQQWKVPVRTSSLPPSRAAGVLASDEADVIVSAGQISGARSIPFFGDEQERAWSLSVEGKDRRFEAALRAFLLPALETGAYGSRYLAVFGSVPTYEAVRPLVFPAPSPGSSPRRAASPEPRPTPSQRAGPAPEPTKTPETVVYRDKKAFLDATGAISATGPLPNLGRVTTPISLGAATFSLGPNAKGLHVGTEDSSNIPNKDWTARLTGADIAIDAREDLNVAFGAPVRAVGSDFVEPQNDFNGNRPFVDSTFQVTLLRESTVVHEFSFNAPNDTATFAGATTGMAFDRVEIRETVGDIENEYFG